jgi:hypothetical protein
MRHLIALGRLLAHHAGSAAMIFAAAGRVTSLPGVRAALIAPAAVSSGVAFIRGVVADLQREGRP